MCQESDALRYLGKAILENSYPNVNPCHSKVNEHFN